MGETSAEIPNQQSYFHRENWEHFWFGILEEISGATHFFIKYLEKTFLKEFEETVRLFKEIPEKLLK